MVTLENESKAFHPSYDQRNAFVAFSLQEKFGKFNADKARPLGALDFVGHDRRYKFIFVYCSIVYRFATLGMHGWPSTQWAKLKLNKIL